MVSLTPQDKKEEISAAAVQDGLINAGIVFVPTLGLFFWAMNNSPSFVKYTRWQSRTSLVLLPACFTFAYTSERSLQHRMHELANRNDHLRQTAIWADQKHAEQQKLQAAPSSASAAEYAKTTEDQLMQLYRQSVASSGVRIVPELRLHHKAANYCYEHPFHILAGIGVPAIGYIFYGRSGQHHLPFSIKLLHTRVMGQFSVLIICLSLMGFKQYMDQQGKFISEYDAEQSAIEMAGVRAQLLQRIARDKEHQAEVDSLIQKAHDEDVKLGHVHEKKKKGKKHTAHALEEVASV